MTAQAGVRNLPAFVTETDEEVLAQAAEISARYPDFASVRRNYADPFVIAHASVRRGTVVSNERRYSGARSDRLKIPNLCEDRGVPHVRFVDLMRELGWTFTG